MAETTLPLTRRALVAWPRWRESQGLVRRNVEQQCGLSPAEGAALERFQRNLAAVGEPRTWWSVTAARSVLKPELLDRLLGGLHLPEGALTEFWRACRLSSIHINWLEGPLRRRLEPAWARDRQQQECRLRMNRERRAAEQQAIAAALQTTPAARCEPPVIHQREKPVIETETNTKTPATGWPWQQPDGLFGAQEALWDFLEERGIRLDWRLPWRYNAEIGKAIGYSDTSVSSALPKLRAKVGVQPGDLVEAPDTLAALIAGTTVAPPPPLVEAAPSAAETAEKPDEVPPPPELVHRSELELELEDGASVTDPVAEPVLTAAAAEASSAEPVGIPRFTNGHARPEQLNGTHPASADPLRTIRLTPSLEKGTPKELTGQIALRMAAGDLPNGLAWHQLSISQRCEVLRLAADVAALVLR